MGACSTLNLNCRKYDKAMSNVKNFKYGIGKIIEKFFGQLKMNCLDKVFMCTKFAQIFH